MGVMKRLQLEKAEREYDETKCSNCGCTKTEDEQPNDLCFDCYLKQED